MWVSTVRILHDGMSLNIATMYAYYICMHTVLELSLGLKIYPE